MNQIFNTFKYNDKFLNVSLRQKHLIHFTEFELTDY